MNYLQALILAIIEGVTEFLPVSSTGHMIIGSSLMGIASQDFTKLFTVCIQFGAILSVLVLYIRKFFKSFDFYVKLFIAFLPAALLGKLFGDLIDQMLESVVTVGVSLLLGGIVLLFVDKWFEKSLKDGKQDASKQDAIWIGIFQCLALVPGVSRSAATIIGGVFKGMNKKSAAEFSFFLAVPTMFAASCYKLFQFSETGLKLTQDEWVLLAFGNAVAFVVAMFAIKSFISFLTSHGFKIFGYYRIIVGLIILTLQAMGVSLSLV